MILAVLPDKNRLTVKMLWAEYHVHLDAKWKLTDLLLNSYAIRRIGTNKMLDDYRFHSAKLIEINDEIDKLIQYL